MNPSLLWPSSPLALTIEPPAYFHDLNLDRVVEGVVGKLEFDLRPLFYTPLQDLEAIRYRQAVVADLEQPALNQALWTFTQAQHTLREHLERSQKLSNPYQRQGFFLEAAQVYVDAVRALEQALEENSPSAPAWRRVTAYLKNYTASPAFQNLERETQALRQALAEVHYTLLLQGDRVTVRAGGEELDYQGEIELLFARFRQGAPKDYRVGFSEWNTLNHIEERILEGLVRLFPRVFAELESFARHHQGFPDPVITTLDWEVQFYLGYLDYCRPLREAGFAFCLPEVGTEKQVSLEEGFELAVAQQQLAEGRKVVPNSFSLEGAERILVVTGPNQGGKTTFARMVGQAHHLAHLGLAVPGRSARLFLCDQIFTHFERREAAQEMRGKLQDELLRIHQALSRATPRSLLVLNEAFSSTSLDDARFLMNKILQAVARLDALAVVVTFIEELASFSETTVSMVAQVDPDDPALRTFRVVRQQADGKAYALAIARKHGLSYPQLKTRLALSRTASLGGSGEGLPALS
ncbi:MAG: DNA mismatch repair protein MutS [Meiothermus sp.]|uniref:MutS-related protein n=1 Tax=Meiothermus sp. TaxID=1955249 RepID=UPI0025E4FE91|nr:DNA mismatch repair protein MutS [Meiothermus sp.]MCS7058488.1 DNA mismatch repair protein MutS [Meiothermus sp.]MCS7195314.1 DNA mismatch repair protein MutS [Meiothermus sp.]MCX7741014.1 DNA mismatch repair protein MutS [Meiothermus sp.]MDW8091659.1 DNA mismatch repair protein MutS [Meiothermus sp.]MDW8480975.1 DNA mismatch repair protein MutS [Meiothermus sp.]